MTNDRSIDRRAEVCLGQQGGGTCSGVINSSCQSTDWYSQHVYSQSPTCTITNVVIIVRIGHH